MGWPKGVSRKTIEAAANEAIEKAAEDSAPIVQENGKESSLVDVCESVRKAVECMVDKNPRDTRLIAAINGVVKAIHWLKEIEGKNA